MCYILELWVIFGFSEKASSEILHPYRAQILSLSVGLYEEM